MNGLLQKLFGKRALMAPVSGIKECCQDPANLTLIEQRSAPQPHTDPVPIEVRRCTECGCRHHRMIVGQRMQPGRVGIG